MAYRDRALLRSDPYRPDVPSTEIVRWWHKVIAILIAACAVVALYFLQGHSALLQWTALIVCLASAAFAIHA